jgi:hypothetical protein
VGYHRASYTEDAPCELLDGSAAPNVTQLCSATFSDHVQVTQGYARIPGNRCFAGTDLSPKSQLCPGNLGITAALRGFFYSHHMPVTLSLGSVLVFSIWSIQRQRAAKRLSGGLRSKKYDTPSAVDDDDDFERECLIDSNKL